MLALGAAPAIVRAESLMKIVVPTQKLIVPNSTFVRMTVDAKGKLIISEPPALLEQVQKLRELYHKGYTHDLSQAIAIWM